MKIIERIKMPWAKALQDEAARNLGSLARAVERNSVGEIIMPVWLDALTETRIELSKSPKKFLEAFEHIAGREALILSAVHKYLATLTPEAVEKLIPVLRAMAKHRTEQTKSAAR